jgi:hypothetical protein
MEGDYCQVEYKEKVIFSRNTSWLLKDPRNLENPINRPYIGDFVEVKGKSVRQLINIPKREEMREFLLNPPEPPFEIAIAESGQKHILFLASTAYGRASFPVVFEQNTIIVDARWRSILSTVESLLLIGFTKTEILSGDYRGDRLLKALGRYEEFESIIAPHRKGRSIQLALHVARSPEKQ